MGFVVKIIGHPAAPQWIGHNTTIGRKSMVPRDEARIFATEIEAQWEINVFKVLVPDGVHFELEDE
jgi:hypothetical protein